MQLLDTLLDWHLWISPLFWLSWGVLAGLISERLVLGGVRRLLSHTPLALSEQLTTLLRGAILWLFALWGASMATYSMPFLHASTLEFLRKVIFVIVMLICIRLIAKMAVALVRFYLNHSSDSPALPNTSIFENIIRFGVGVVGLLMLLQTLGVSVLPIITALGVGGLAISLALQDTLANFFAGLNMLMARQIRVGDTIQLESGLSGQVTDITWRTTILRQLSGNSVILPNSKLASNTLVRFAQLHPDLNVSLTVAVPLEADFDAVEQLAFSVAEQVGKRLLQEKHAGFAGNDAFQPLIRFASFEGGWANMSVILPFPAVIDAGLARHELLKALHTAWSEQGWSYPLPRHIVSLAYDDNPERGVPLAARLS